MSGGRLPTKLNNITPIGIFLQTIDFSNLNVSDIETRGASYAIASCENTTGCGVSRVTPQPAG
jgi:hypothetical protein